MMSVGSYSAQHHPRPPPAQKICHWLGYYYSESVTHSPTHHLTHVYKTPDP